MIYAFSFVSKSSLRYINLLMEKIEYTNVFWVGHYALDNSCTQWNENNFKINSVQEFCAHLAW